VVTGSRFKNDQISWNDEHAKVDNAGVGQIEHGIDSGHAGDGRGADVAWAINLNKSAARGSRQGFTTQYK
jgi:hypothetical protein